jgi:hypothetical protein
MKILVKVVFSRALTTASGCTTVRLPAAVKAPVIRGPGAKTVPMRQSYSGPASAMRRRTLHSRREQKTQSDGPKISANPVMANTETPIAPRATLQKAAFSK